jgi:hypothetical protein
MANGGFTFTQGLNPQIPAQQQQAQQQATAGTADMIVKAGSLMQQKKEQAYVQYENARKYMRADLNTIAEFDASAAGMGQFSGAITELAEDARERIKEANNTIEAQEIIANFKEQYDMLVAREASVTEKKNLFQNASHATGPDIDSLNDGLDVDLQYVIPEVSDVATSQNSWDNPFADGIQIVDGRIMAIDPTDGMLKEISEIESVLDSSMFDLQTEQITAGSISDWAINGTTKAQIGLKDGTWNANRAGSLYDDAIDDVGRTGDKTSSGAMHRREVLNTLEGRGLVDVFTAEERKAFINGDFDFFNTESAKETLEEVMAKGREIFVEESKFGFKSSETLEAEALAIQKTKQEALEGYSMRGLTASTEVGEQTFDLYSIPETIKVEGSSHVEGGQYSIFGFNVDPSTGDIVARIKKEEKVLMYEYVDENNVVQLAATLEQAQKLGKPTGETEEFLRGSTPETITINSDGSGLSREVYNKLFAEDPIALQLVMEEKQSYNQRKLDEAIEEKYQNTPENVDPDAVNYTPAETNNVEGLISVEDLMKQLPSSVKESLNVLGFEAGDIEEIIKSKGITSATEFADLVTESLEGR